MTIVTLLPIPKGVTVTGDLCVIVALFLYVKSKGSKALSFGLLAGMAFGKMAPKGHPESGTYSGAAAAYINTST